MKTIALSGKIGKGFFVLVDDEDYCRCSKKVWHMTRNKRAKSKHKNKIIFLHRFILNFPHRMIDHINRNPLDNRKENLRLCNNSQNRANSPPKKGKLYKGIRKRGKNWCAQIILKKKSIYLGTFKTEIEAAKAYNKAAKDNYGDFAWLNPV